jgi:hypothetical protein
MLRSLLASCVAVSLLVGGPALAQTSDGSLRGYVRDEQGGVLPGVTVTATSPALLGPVVAVSESDGLYRLNNLPPGTYTVTAELTGFVTYRQVGILARAGSTFSIDIVMKVGNLAETVTVSGEAPMIETLSPSSTLNIPGELMREAPVSSRRLFSDVLDIAPGINSRQLQGLDMGKRAYYFHGAHIWSHNITLEGAPASAYADASAHSMDMSGDTVADVALKVGGADASSPLSTGIVMNIIAPRGGNIFKGSAAYSYQALSWNGDNASSLGGVPTFQGIKQADVSLGGPIAADKAWFFGSYRYADLINGISRTAQNLAALTAFRPDFQPFNDWSKSQQPFVKVTAQISTKHEFSAFFQRDRSRFEQDQATAADPVLLGGVGGSLVQGRVTSVWTDHLTSQVSAAWNNKSLANSDSYQGQAGVGPQVLVHKSTFLSSGLPTGTGELIREHNVQDLFLQPSSMVIIRGDLTYFREGWGGSHEIKTGIWAAPWLHYDVIDQFVNDGFVLQEVRQVDPNNPAAGTVPFHLRYDSPATLETVSNRDRDVGVYVQDAWKPHPRLTANVGVRADFIRRHDALFDVDREKSVAIGPRVGVAYLVTNDARTVLRGSYGRFYEQVNGRDTISLLGSLNGSGNTQTNRLTIRDVYLNADGSQTTIITPPLTPALISLEFAPGLRQPHADDFIVGLRHQFRGQLSLDVSGTRRYYKDQFALVDINGIYPSAPGQPFGGFGRVDPNRGIFYQEQNDTWSTHVLTFLEGTVTKNLANNFQLVGSLTRQWQHLDGTWNPTDPARFIQPTAFPTNKEVGGIFGNDENNSLNGSGSPSGSAYRPYSIRMAGQYFAPGGMMLASTYVIQAGDYSGPIVTRLTSPDPTFGPPLVVLANGTTQPNPLATTIRFAFPTRGDGQVLNEVERYLQLTVARPFKVGRQEFQPTLNIFNVFNTGVQEQWIGGSNQLYNPNYLLGMNQHPPRSFSVTVIGRF